MAVQGAKREAAYGGAGVDGNGVVELVARWGASLEQQFVTGSFVQAAAAALAGASCRARQVEHRSIVCQVDALAHAFFSN